MGRQAVRSMSAGCRVFEVFRDFAACIGATFDGSNLCWLGIHGLDIAAPANLVAATRNAKISFDGLMIRFAPRRQEELRYD
jgi:hypothetical protein